MTHEELLAKYAQAALGVIAERSGDIGGDARGVRDEVNAYAREHGIGMPDPDIFDAYIVEDWE